MSNKSYELYRNMSWACAAAVAIIVASYFGNVGHAWAPLLFVPAAVIGVVGIVCHVASKRFR